MAEAVKKAVAPKKEAEPVANDPTATEESLGEHGLTDRQRTKLEKRDAVKEFDADEEKDTSHCDNHPDREAVVVTDGVAFAPQAYCEECALKYGHPLPPKE